MVPPLRAQETSANWTGMDSRRYTAAVRTLLLKKERCSGFRRARDTGAEGEERPSCNIWCLYLANACQASSSSCRWQEEKKAKPVLLLIEKVLIFLYIKILSGDYKHPTVEKLRKTTKSACLQYFNLNYEAAIIRVRSKKKF